MNQEEQRIVHYKQKFSEIDIHGTGEVTLEQYKSWVVNTGEEWTDHMEQ